jgi:shikimate dehydrogenase
MEKPSPHLIRGKAKLAGVIGWPIEQSLSPALHGYWLNQNQIDGAYVPLSVAPENFEKVVKALSSQGFRGFNITSPYKEQILPLLDEVDDHAQRLGAVNTVVIDNDGRLLGTNTDGFGFVESLAEASPDWALNVNSAMILGAGGAAKAIALALYEARVKTFFISNRTTSRAQELAAQLKRHDVQIECVPFPPGPEDLERADLLVNATTLGMAGGQPLEIDLDGLTPDSLVADIVYNPLKTKLLDQAQARRLQSVDGLGMLLNQARAGFERWFGVAPQVTREQRELLEGLLSKKAEKP